jgi:hypothetical protein
MIEGLFRYLILFNILAVNQSRMPVKVTGHSASQPMRRTTSRKSPVKSKGKLDNDNSLYQKLRLL